MTTAADLPGPVGFRTRGHAAAVRAVARAVVSGRPPHALLLAGPRGVGKTTLARDLAAGLLCLAADPEARPCRACVACHKVDVDGHPDVHRLAPTGAGEQIRLEQVQRLVTELALTPLEGRVRVAIIRAAHRLNPDAQNALLKTLEEPPPGTCLVLCADDTAALLPTVISRTARLRLAPLGIERLTDLLIEQGIASGAPARALAIAAAGRPGIAVTLAAEPEAVIARERVARTLLGLLDADRRTRLGAAGDLIADGARIDAALRAEPAPTAKRLQPAERRRSVSVVLDIWRAVGRDLAVIIRADARAVDDLDLLEELRSAGPRVDPDRLATFLDRLDRLRLAIEEYAGPELVLDHLLLRWTGTGATAPGRP